MVACVHAYLKYISLFVKMRWNSTMAKICFITEKACLVKIMMWCWLFLLCNYTPAIAEYILDSWLLKFSFTSPTHTFSYHHNFDHQTSNGSITMTAVKIDDDDSISQSPASRTSSMTTIASQSLTGMYMLIKRSLLCQL